MTTYTDDRDRRRVPTAVGIGGRVTITNIRYRDQRNNGLNAVDAWYIATGSVAFDQLDTEPYTQDYYQLERDGRTYRIRIEFDSDANFEALLDVIAGEPYIAPAPHWWVAVYTDDDGLIDSIGAIEGGYWDGRDEPDMDDRTKAYIWHEYIEPATREAP